MKNASCLSTLRRVSRIVFVPLLVVMTLFALAAEQASAAPRGYRQGRILVQRRSGRSHSLAKNLIARHRGRILRRLRNSQVEMVQVPAGREQAIIASLRKDSGILFAELDELVPLADTTPDDTYYAHGWHLTKIKCPTAWDNVQGSGIKVAVLDTGVNSNHTDLSGQVLTGYNVPNQDSTTTDVNGHGTMVAGVVAALTNNNTGVASIAYKAKILPIRVTNQSNGYAYFSDIASGLTWAANNGAKVANISYDVTGSSSVGTAAQYFQSKGGLVVVAAGNSGSNPGHSDSAYMISVSATTSSDAFASWSSYGNYVDVAAPGSGIWTTTSSGSYSAPSGTSFASPVTAGVCALIMSANSSLTPAQVESILESTAVDLGSSGYDSSFGNGRIDAAAAVTKALPNQDNQSPTAQVTSPSGGSTVSGTVTVDVSASDNVGVSKVELYVNSLLVATDTASPFVFSWNSASISDGTASLTAVAHDAAGNSTTSSAVSVTVDNVEDDTTPPAVSITTPTAGATVSGSVSIGATASDNVGVTKVEFYAGGTLLKSDSTSPYSASWDTTSVSDGNVSLTAKAFDAAGNTKTSAAVTVSLRNVESDTTAPFAIVTGPKSGTTVSGTTTVTVTATDNVGVTKVEFRLDGTLLGTDTSAPFAFSWDTTRMSDGSCSLTAKAFDAAGNTKTSSAVSVSVKNVEAQGDTTPPKVWFASPSSGSQATGRKRISVRASDASGIASIKLYVDGKLVKTVTGRTRLTYRWNTRKASAGNHTLMAVGTDKAGNTASTSITLVVPASKKRK